jgi:translation initiation factor IF-2
VSAPKQLQLVFPITVKDLAMKLDVKANELIKHLMGKRIFASLTQWLEQPVATQVAKEFGCELAPQPSLEEQLLQDLEPEPAKLVPRAPVVTFMGHVDHGKTSLLDAIRQSKIVEKEAGGITQHIGAYEVVLEKGRVTLLDTPGHEAFTALRARGANVTDVVVLVVAADDGVMPQTVEAIDHAKAADVPIVVAVNKMDKPEANPQKVKQQLTQYGLVAEDWGGKTIMVPVSARTGQGIDSLLEMLLLEAELLELKADPTKPAQGTVIEARLSKDTGPIATLLIQQGTLHVGDLLVVGVLSGRVRAMINDRGHRVKEAQPGTPVEVLGIPGVPRAGDRFLVLADEKTARQLVEQREGKLVERQATPPKRITLEDLHQRIVKGQLKELKLVLKADVQGSLEAIVQSLAKIPTPEVKLQTIHMGVGEISESDVMLAAASDAVVIGFHVGVDPQVQVEAIKEGVDIRIFQIIYELVNAIKAALEGLLEPKIEEAFLGRAEVRRLFQISKVGIVAGCVVTKGTIRRDALLRVVRGKDRLLETKIASLKRVKDDVREVQEGVECGIALEGNLDLQAGDLLEAWEQRKVARKLA